MTDAKRAAPGELELVRAFVNTFDVLDDKDEIRTLPDAERWLRDHGLLGRRTSLSVRDHSRLLKVREGLRTLAHSNNGAEVDRAALRGLNQAASVPMVMTFNEEGAELGADGDGADAAIGKIVSIVFNAIADGSWARMKACADDECLWLYYDHSKNRSKAWCNMAVCGNRAKARAYRARVRSSG